MKQSLDTLTDETATGPTRVDTILAELRPLMLRQRRAMTRRWCFGDVSTTHLHVVMLIESEGELSMTRLADLLDVSLPNATGIVTRMEERGLVERVRDGQDRRVVLVRLTETGRGLTDEVEFVRRQHLTRILEAMSSEQQEHCLTTFRTLRETSDRLEASGELTADEPELSRCRGRSGPSAPGTPLVGD
jgi:DNA-binding MarR family transcriptional regulator